MPPNLGGFFMVRSYYPSECHADYFDFERIEALKPAIEACGISDRKSGSAGMPRPISYAVFCLKKKIRFIDGFAVDGRDQIATDAEPLIAEPNLFGCTAQAPRISCRS